MAHQHQHHHVLVGPMEEPQLLQQQQQHHKEKKIVTDSSARVSDLEPGTKLMNLQSTDRSEMGGGGGGGVSPKSVITEMRFVSPDSSTSSSSSMQCCGVTAAAAGGAALIHGCSRTRSKWLPSLHDRGYSISDGEISDSESSVFDSSNASSSSTERLKMGPLESLPETHSLDLDGVRPRHRASTAGGTKAPGKGRSSITTGLRNEVNRFCSEHSSSVLQGRSTSSSAVSPNQVQDLSKLMGRRRGPTEKNCSNPHTVPQIPQANNLELKEAVGGNHPAVWVSTTTKKNPASLTKQKFPESLTAPTNYDENASAMMIDKLHTNATNFVQIAAQAPTQSSDRLQAAGPASSDDFSAESNRKISLFSSRSHVHWGGGGANEAHARLQAKLMSSATTDPAASVTTEQSDNNAKARQLADQVPSSAASTLCIVSYPRTPQRFFPHLHGVPAFSVLNSSSPPVAAAAAAAAANLVTARSRGAGSHGNRFLYSPASSSEKYTAAVEGTNGQLLHQRVLNSSLLFNPMVPKLIPSKWDDAEKWITSPGHHQSPAHPQFWHLPVLIGSEPGRRHSITSTQGLQQSYDGAGSQKYSTGIGKGQRQVPSGTQKKKHAKTLSFGDLSKRFDLSQAARKSSCHDGGDTDEFLQFEEGDNDDDRQSADMSKLDSFPAHTTSSFMRVIDPGGPAVVEGKSVNKSPHHHEMPIESVEKIKSAHHSFDSGSKELTPRSSSPSSFDQCPKDEFSSSVDWNISNLLKAGGDHSVCMKEIGTDPPTPPAFHTPQPSLGHRDMGTQITPTESQRNSMCTSPKYGTSPLCDNTEPACLSTSESTKSVGLPPPAVPGLDLLQVNSCHLAKLELRNLANYEDPMIDRNPTWTIQQDDELEHAGKLRQTCDLQDMERGILVSKATAWEQVELAKCTTRYDHEEAKILAWEALEKSKADNKLKKKEVKLEKKRLHAIEKMQEQVAVTCQKAQDMRAAAKTHCHDKAAKTTARAHQIINTGQLPFSQKLFKCCICS